MPTGFLALCAVGPPGQEEVGDAASRRWQGPEKQEHSTGTDVRKHSRDISCFWFSPPQTQARLHLVTKPLSAFLYWNLLAHSYRAQWLLLFLQPQQPQNNHVMWLRSHNPRLAKERTVFPQPQKSVWEQECDLSPNRVLPRILLDPPSWEFQGHPKPSAPGSFA